MHTHWFNHAFWTSVWLFLTPYLIAGAGGIITVLALVFLSRRQRDVKYARLLLETAKTMLKAKLGNKADAVIDVWLGGLDAIGDGDFTEAEMIDEFTKFIQIAVNGTLSESELHVVREAATFTIQMFKINSSVVKQQAKLMSVN